MAATNPIRSKKQVHDLAQHFLTKNQPRNHLLIVLGVHTALRISDMLRLTWNSVYDFKRGNVRNCVTIAEAKTNKPKTFKLNRKVAEALVLLHGSLNPQSAEPLFKNLRTGNAISRIQAYRIIRAASESLELERVSCHSLRKTFGYHAWKSGVPVAVIMEIYNHSSFAVTRRYLGISQDDKNAVYHKLGKVL
ncbi:MAG: tyrosine-type recombinase/integrase [Oscillospiraceae bacterium]|nr:tyrosine-type recombinase/integrase [Oscillospiraceae bacterium]